MFGTSPLAYEPLQIYHLNLPGICCQRETPAESLRSNIYYYWMLEITLPEFDLEIIPDNAVDLVMSSGLPNFSALYFPVAEKFTIPLNGPVVYTGISFNVAQITRCLDHDLAKLKSLDAGQATTESLQLSSLVRDIQGLAEFSSVVNQMNHFWEQRLLAYTGTTNSAPPVLDHERWISVLQQSMGNDSVQTIADRTGLSERQFRRISTQLFGMSPKKIQRVQRLQSAVRELFSADAVKIENDYYDDSHRIKELKKLTGFTPGDIRRMAEMYNH